MKIKPSDLPARYQAHAREMLAQETETERKLRAERAKAQRSGLEESFLLQVRSRDLPEPEREYRFHPHRKWRFDFAWPEQKVGVEIQGGTWSGGRHVRGKGAQGDMEKLNAAQALGWRVYLFDSEHVRTGEAGGCIEDFLTQAPDCV